MHIDRIDPAFGHWFAGFTDGEGCFYIGRPTYRGGIGSSYQCAFSISLRIDDRDVVERIHAVLGMGIVGFRPGRNLSAPTVLLTIRKKADVVALCEFFDHFPLRSKKAQDFAIWRLAVAEWASANGVKGRPHDWALMARFHRDLKNVRKFA